MRGANGHPAEVTDVVVSTGYSGRWMITFLHSGVGGSRSTAVMDLSDRDLVGLQHKIVTALAERRSRR